MKRILTAIAIVTFIVNSSVQAQITDEEVAAKKQALMQGIDGRTADEREQDLAVMERYSDAIVIDALVPGTPNGYVGGPVAEYEEMVSRSKDHGFDAVSYTAAIDDTYEPLQIVHWIGAALKYYNSKPETYALVDTVDDLRRAKNEGKFAVMLNFQGSNALGSRLEMVDAYYAMGVRQMNFAYNVRNFMADGGGVDPARDAGLSKMGFQLVAEMNRVGMIVDCTHSSNKTCLDAASVSTKPIVLSHSNAYGAYNLPRNSPDEVLKAVAATGGVMCTNGLGGFLNAEGNARPEDIAIQVNYIKELVGVEHTCFGSDHLTAEVYIEALDFVLRNPDSYPPELGYGAQTQIALPRDIWGVVAVLEGSYGWTQDEVRGFLGENLMRVYEANWE
jgi:microsomal dipeptidase-like Zn-dependent dipeptidase